MNKNEYLQLVYAGIDKVKNFNITVTTKAGHKSKLYELKQLYIDLMIINPYLFDPEYSYEWRQYKLNLETGRTKKDLDNNLRYCIITINKELQAILNDVYNDNIKFDNVWYNNNIKSKEVKNVKRIIRKKLSKFLY